MVFLFSCFVWYLPTPSTPPTLTGYSDRRYLRPVDLSSGVDLYDPGRFSPMAGLLNNQTLMKKAHLNNINQITTIQFSTQTDVPDCFIYLFGYLFLEERNSAPRWLL